MMAHDHAGSSRSPTAAWRSTRRAASGGRTATLLARPSGDPASRSAAAWAEEQHERARALDRIGSRASTGGWPEHPAFAPVKGRDWGVLQ
jgi:hypothetical protein